MIPIAQVWNIAVSYLHLALPIIRWGDARERDPNCWAWSYVVSTQTCSLKSGVPLPQTNPGVISGRKGTETMGMRDHAAAQ